MEFVLRCSREQRKEREEERKREVFAHVSRGRRAVDHAIAPGDDARGRVAEVEDA